MTRRPDPVAYPPHRGCGGPLQPAAELGLEAGPPLWCSLCSTRTAGELGDLQHARLAYLGEGKKKAPPAPQARRAAPVPPPPLAEQLGLFDLPPPPPPQPVTISGRVLRRRRAA